VELWAPAERISELCGRRSDDAASVRGRDRLAGSCKRICVERWACLLEQLDQLRQREDPLPGRSAVDDGRGDMRQLESQYEIGLA
jgi:hypothetical protein